MALFLDQQFFFCGDWCYPYVNLNENQQKPVDYVPTSIDICQPMNEKLFQNVSTWFQFAISLNLDVIAILLRTINILRGFVIISWPYNNFLSENRLNICNMSNFERQSHSYGTICTMISKTIVRNGTSIDIFAMAFSTNDQYIHYPR